VYKFSEFKRLTGKFFFWFIKHHFIFVTEDQNSKSTVDSLRRPLIDEFPFVNPPLSEQHQIVSYLDEHTQMIDKTISVEERRIELLKDYRQSLMNNGIKC
jgi:type I restriction enzyme S subunit